MGVHNDFHANRYYIVIGGEKGDTSSMQLGCKVINPLIHSSQNYNDQDLPFVLNNTPATQESLETTPNPPEPGTMVLVDGVLGDPSTKIVTAQFPNVTQMKTAEGNNDLHEWLRRAFKKPVGKNRPTSFVEKEERKALVRDIENEKGEWTHDLVKGIRADAAFSTLAGQILPQVKNIDTAIQKALNIPSAGMLANLPGSFMSLSSMLSKLTNKQKKSATSSMSPEVTMALESIQTLLTDGEISNSSITSGRVHEETFIQNAIDLLSQVTTIHDLIGVLDRLRHDTSLHGLENIETIEYRTNTAYGEIVQTIDYLGNLVMDANSQNIITAATSSLTSSMGSSQAGDPLKNLFGDGTQNMANAFSRLAGSGEEFRNKLVRDVVQKTKQAQHDTVHDLTCGKGNPLSCFFNSSAGA